MGQRWTRLGMAGIGVVVLLVYTGAAIGGILLLQWLFANPPRPAIVLAAFTIVVVVGGYAGYRLGTLRVIASLETRELEHQEAPEVHRRLDRLATRMNVAKPPVLLADLGAPNALSLGGPKRGVIVLDYRLLRLLTIDELEGILAHELAHMEGYDTFVNTLVITAVRTLVGLVFLLVFPIVLLLVGIDRGAAWFAGNPGQWRYGLAHLFQLGVTVLLGIVLSLFTLAFLARSRRREFVADDRAAAVTGKPESLARALAKIHRASQPQRGLLSLLYIHDEKDPVDQWLSTHPPLDDRIERLLSQVDRPVGPRYIGRIRP